jgi:hypothetical protein
MTSHEIHELVNEHPKSELVHYSTDEVVELYKAPGTTFTMRELAHRVALDPVGSETGCVYVQTVKTIDDQQVRNRYYFDSQAMFDNSLNQATHLQDVNLEDDAYKITIGENWISPLGKADGQVEAIVMPYTHGYFDARNGGDISPLTRGRNVLNWIAAQK